MALTTISGVAQTQKQRAAAERARIQREIAAREKRKARQRLYAIAAGVLSLVLVASLALAAFLGNRNETTPAAVTTPSAENPFGAVAMAEVAPSPALAEGRMWTATFATTGGDIVVELDGIAAPQAVASFIGLAREGFFDGTLCHRLTTAGIFVLQCGDPTATGTGGPNFRFGPIENAPGDDLYVAGTLAMARVGNNAESMGSQFFLVYEDSVIPSDAAGGYTVFGHIISGLDIVRAVAETGVAGGGGDGRPAVDFTIEGVTVQ